MRALLDDLPCMQKSIMTEKTMKTMMTITLNQTDEDYSDYDYSDYDYSDYEYFDADDDITILHVLLVVALG